MAGSSLVMIPSSSNNSGSSLVIPRDNLLTASGIATPSAIEALDATLANLSIFLVDIPPEEVCATACIASLIEIAPPDSSANLLDKPPKFLPTAAPSWSSPFIILSVSIEVLKPLNAAPSANILAAYVAYRRTNPSSPCA